VNEKNSDFLFNINEIIVAHKFIIEGDNVCDYTQGRRFYGLVYVIEGSATYLFSDGDEVNVYKDSCFLVGKDAKYKVQSDNSFVHYTINFSVDSYFGDVCEKLIENEKIVLEMRGDRGTYKSLFEKICKCWKGKNQGYRMISMGVLYELLYTFCLNTEKNEYGRCMDVRILPAKEYIEKNFDKEIRLEYLAKMCDMSITNFRRSFCEGVGMTPMAYKDSIILLHAKDFLSSGIYNVSECAGECGFEDVNYFCRFFKKHTGLTPTEYKNSFIYLINN